MQQIFSVEIPDYFQKLRPDDIRLNSCLRLDSDLLCRYYQIRHASTSCQFFHHSFSDLQSPSFRYYILSQHAGHIR